MAPSSKVSLTLVLLSGILVGGGVTWSASASQPIQSVSIVGRDYSETPEQKERRERSERLFKQKVDTVAARLGEHRRAEAERLVRMQEAAEAARPKQITPTRSANNDNGQCSERRVQADRSFTSQVSEADARERAQVFSNRECMGGQLSCSGITCTRNAFPVPGGARQWAEKNVAGLVTYQCTLAATQMRQVCDGPRNGSRVSSQ